MTSCYLHIHIRRIALLDTLLRGPAVAFDCSKVLSIHHHVGLALRGFMHREGVSRPLVNRVFLCTLLPTPLDSGVDSLLSLFSTLNLQARHGPVESTSHSRTSSSDLASALGECDYKNGGDGRTKKRRVKVSFQRALFFLHSLLRFFPLNQRGRKKARPYVCISILRNFVLRSMPLPSFSAWTATATSAWFMPGAGPAMVIVEVCCVKCKRGGSVE